VRVDKLFKALNERRFDDLDKLVQPDVVYELPQSGNGSEAVRISVPALRITPDLLYAAFLVSLVTAARR
jgi:ketosteroid isomerase-like protein